MDVLDKGFIKVIDTLGDDVTIVNWLMYDTK